MLPFNVVQEEEELLDEKNADELLLGLDPTAHDFVAIRAAEYKSGHMWLQKEKEILFTPSRATGTHFLSMHSLDTFLKMKYASHIKDHPFQS